jgi:hypothetical protein
VQLVHYFSYFDPDYINFGLLADAELLEMIERADTDGDGEISPEEFYAIMVCIFYVFRLLFCLFVI